MLLQGFTQARRITAETALHERMQELARLLLDTAGLVVMIGTLVMLAVLVATV